APCWACSSSPCSSLWCSACSANANRHPSHRPNPSPRQPRPKPVGDQPAPVSSRAEAQRSRILNAAQQCFIEHGFHAAGMALISAAAGMSPGLIYRYFENKNAIILAIIERQLDEARADIAALQSGTDL